VSARAALAVAGALAAAACSSVSTVRLRPEDVDVGAGMRPIAGVQAEVTTFYLLYIPIPGDISLDRVVNRMLIVAAKTMGADKITGLSFAVECPNFCFAKLLGTVGARATGIAVQLSGPPADAAADDGPEAPPPR
jgi:hypothetical protein